MQKERKKTDKKIKRETNTPIGFHMEIDKGVFGMLLVVQSVKSITNVESDAIVMKVGKGRVEIRGENLEIVVYENRIVEVSGKISKVEFL